MIAVVGVVGVELLVFVSVVVVVLFIVAYQ